jgi:hypothetical protein
VISESIPPVSSLFEFEANIGIRGTIRLSNAELPEIESEIQNAIETATDMFDANCRGHNDTRVSLKVNRDARIALYSLLEVSP